MQIMSSASDVLLYLFEKEYNYIMLEAVLLNYKYMLYKSKKKLIKLLGNITFPNFM